jgi:hypothetical protein
MRDNLARIAARRSVQQPRFIALVLAPRASRRVTELGLLGRCRTALLCDGVDLIRAAYVITTVWGHHVTEYSQSFLALAAARRDAPPAPLLAVPQLNPVKKHNL